MERERMKEQVTTRKITRGIKTIIQDKIIRNIHIHATKTTTILTSTKTTTMLSITTTSSISISTATTTKLLQNQHAYIFFQFRTVRQIEQTFK